jgi:hypothetical protein
VLSMLVAAEGLLSNSHVGPQCGFKAVAAAFSVSVSASLLKPETLAAPTGGQRFRRSVTLGMELRRDARTRAGYGSCLKGPDVFGD